MPTSGASRRLARLFKRRPSIWLPIDDALISGPTGALGDMRTLRDPRLIDQLDAVMGFRGALERCWSDVVDTPLVVNLSASTIHGRHFDKVLVTSVEAAARMGADAVAFHLNLGAENENDMLHRFGATVDAAESLGFPVIAISYPRREMTSTVEGDAYVELRERDPRAYANLVRHAVRVGVEMGAAAVKTVYTDDEELFASVIDAALGAPVVVAGGPPVDDETALRRAEGSMRAGATGIAFGRQIFLNDDAPGFVEQVRMRLTSQTSSPSNPERLSSH